MELWGGDLGVTTCLGMYVEDLPQDLPPSPHSWVLGSGTLVSTHLQATPASQSRNNGQNLIYTLAPRCKGGWEACSASVMAFPLPLEKSSEEGS
jgi:hypothetical protein